MDNQQINNTETITVANKNKTIKIIASIALVAVILIAVIIIIAVKSQSVNIGDYITNSIEFSGYDGYGKVETNNNDFINYDQLYIDLGIEQNNMVSMFGAESVFYDYIDISTTNGDSQNLKNGDTVTYTFTINYDGINNLNGKKKLKGDDSITKDYEVSGLSEVTEINPFDAVEKVIVSDKYNYNNVVLQIGTKIGNYSITSTSSIGYAFNVGENKITVNFEAPEIDSINAGDKITLSLAEELDRYASYGIIFTTDSNEFSVLTTKDVTDASQITQTSYEILKTMFDDKARAQNDGDYSFEKMYFKSTTGKYTKTVTNELIGIYRYKSNAIGSTDEYVCIYIDSPEITSDGEILKTADVYINKNYDLSEYHSVSELEAKLAENEPGIEVTNFKEISY